MDILQKALEDDILDLTHKDLAKLYELDIFTLGKQASKIRENMHQNKVFFNMNRHINPSNICADVCKFCAFSAGKKNPNPYEMSIEEIINQVIAANKRGVKEVHIVSAHNPNHSYEWYFKLFKAVKKSCPNIHLKAMTAAEVDFLTRKFNVSYELVLDDMINSGVDSMPGGGAEIFDEQVRKKICNGKVKSSRWIDIHKRWHKLGRMSNATMLFGHIESRENRIDHMLRLKNAQASKDSIDSKQGGFNAFIPLVYQKYNNLLDIKHPLSGQEILKTISISRILLQNIPNIKAYWATLGLNTALVAQEFGANDMDGTIENESIQSAGGAKSKKGLQADEIISQIKNARFRAIERDSLYNEIKEF